MGMLLTWGDARKPPLFDPWSVLGPVLFLVGCAVVPSESLPIILLTLTILEFARSLQRDCSVLTTLRNNRGMSDLLATQTSAAELVDDLAGASARRSLRKGLSFLVTGWSVLLFRLPSHPAMSLGGLLLWPALYAGVAYSGAYLAILLAAWTDQGRESARAQMMGAAAAATAGVPAGLLFVGSALLCGLGYAQWACLSLLLCLSYVFFISRPVGILGLEKFDQLEAVSGRSARQTGPHRWLRPWSSNPIVVRETARDAAHLPADLPGTLLGRCGTFVVVLAFSTYTVLGSDWGSVAEGGRIRLGSFFWIPVLLLSLLQWGRAIARSFNPILAEREQCQLEALQTTGLTVSEYLHGWTGVAWVPRMLENIVAVPVLVELGRWGHAGSGELVLAVLALPVVTLLGAYIGIWAATASNRRSAQSRLALALGMLAGSGCFFVCLFCSTGEELFTVGGCAFFSGVLLAAAVGLVCLPRLTYRDLSQGQGRIGFVAG